MLVVTQSFSLPEKTSANIIYGSVLNSDMPHNKMLPDLEKNGITASFGMLYHVHDKHVV